MDNRYHTEREAQARTPGTHSISVDLQRALENRPRGTSELLASQEFSLQQQTEDTLLAIHAQQDREDEEYRRQISSVGEMTLTLLQESHRIQQQRRAVGDAILQRRLLACTEALRVRFPTETIEEP